MSQSTLQKIAIVLTILWLMLGLWRAYLGLLFYRLQGGEFFSGKRPSIKILNIAIANEKDVNIRVQLLTLKKQYSISLFLFYGIFLLYLSLILLPAFHIITIH